MIPSTIDFATFKTVLPTYSWDQGTPGVDYNPYLYKTGLAEVKAASTLNDEKVEYVGYAPFALVSLSSDPGGISISNLALEQTVDFGDYYNSETNIVKVPGLSTAEFCHIYVMPGLYTITYTRTEHTYYEVIPLDGEGNCLQKYCVDWSYQALKADIPRQTPFTWKNAQTGQTYQKKWTFERCEASDHWMAGLYIQPTDISVKHPLSWQWYHFLRTPIDVRNDPITWLSAGFQQSKQFTWNDSGAPCVNLPVEGITWRWDNLKKLPAGATVGERLVTKPLSWDQVTSFSPLNTTWDFAQENCSTVGTIILSATTQTIVKKASVRIKEIPPVAYITAEQPQDRLTPATVRLSPRNIISGSFPIEKIVWDLGDGSPLLEQRRWSNTLERPFVYSNAVSNDYEDPRNYDIIYTYTRTISSPSVFYASLTAYAANTCTSDSASVMIGPLKYKNTDGKNFRLLQSELTDQGKVLLGQIDNNNVGVWKIDKPTKQLITIQQTYYYFGYYSADRPLINGVSVLYKGIYNVSPLAASLSGYRVLDETTASDGGSSPDLSIWQTDSNGVISWYKYEKHPYPLDNFIDSTADPSIATSPYKRSDTYFVDTPEIISGKTKLWRDNGSSSGIVANQTFNNLDIDNDGRLDLVTTNNTGVITWAPLSANALNTYLSGYTRTLILTSGVSKLYANSYSNAPLIRLAQGEGYISRTDQGAGIQIDADLDIWQTDGYGTITFNTKILHPYSVGTPIIGYVNDLNFESGTLALYDGQGTSSVLLRNRVGTNTNPLTAYLPSASQSNDISIWKTDSNGILSWNTISLHKYLLNEESEYYVDTSTIVKNSTKVWNGPGTSATIVPFASGQNIINGTNVNWQTNSQGIITFSLLSAYPYKFNLNPQAAILKGQYYYSNVPVLTSTNTDLDIHGSKVYKSFTPEAELIVNYSGTGFVKTNDPNLYNWQVDEFGEMTFSLLSAHPYKLVIGGQTVGYMDTPIPIKKTTKIYNGPGTAAGLVTRAFGNSKLDKETGKIS